MTGTDLATVQNLLDVGTGEVLPATTENAAVVLAAAREMKRRLDSVIHDATAFLLEESRVQGTKTFHTLNGDLALSGGPTVEYDGEVLIDELIKANCPWTRVEKCIVGETVYKVNRAVLRQLAGANEAYAEAARRAERVVEKRWYVKVAS